MPKTIKYLRVANYIDLVFQQHARGWKYDKKIDQHWVEFEESGELQKMYLQREDQTETRTVDAIAKFKDLKPTPAAVSCETAAHGIGNEKPDADREQQVSQHINQMDLGYLWNFWDTQVIINHRGIIHKDSQYEIPILFSNRIDLWGACFLVQEPGFLMSKTLEALLAKSAKLREIHMTLEEENAEPRQVHFFHDPVFHHTCIKSNSPKKR